MDANTAYIQELKAILACDQSDGYLKKWATDWLKKTEYLQYQSKLLTKPEKTSALVV